MTLENTSILDQIAGLRKHLHILDKRHIHDTYQTLGNRVKSSAFFNTNTHQEILLGDDTAAIPQEDGSHLLFASEGIIASFLENDPWFAGYSAIMVNISDICSMGGLPMAVTDTLYAKDAKDTQLIWEGMHAASLKYGVPIVGGHTCYHHQNKALSVSILGKSTKNLLSSFEAKVDEALLIIIDHKGAYFKDYPFWNASTTTDAKTIQQITKLPYKIANKQWSNCAKDISMGGILGTLLMLMHTSKTGVTLNLNNLETPPGVPVDKWLVSFPSYGFIMTCPQENIAPIQQLFQEHDIQCDNAGRITREKELKITYKKNKLKF